MYIDVGIAIPFYLLSLNEKQPRYPMGGYRSSQSLNYTKVLKLVFISLPDRSTQTFFPDILLPRQHPDLGGDSRGSLLGIMSRYRHFKGKRVMVFVHSSD